MRYTIEKVTYWKDHVTFKIAEFPGKEWVVDLKDKTTKEEVLTELQSYFPEPDAPETKFIDMGLKELEGTQI